MKISYVLGKPPIEPTSDKSVVTMKSHQGLNGFSLEDRWRVRALEINQAFEKEIIETRKTLNIPTNGYTYEEFLGIYNFLEFGYVRGPLTKVQELEFNKKIDIEVCRIVGEYNCDIFVKRNLKTILLANIVLSSSSNMSDWGEIYLKSLFTTKNYESFGKDKSVVIKITSKVSAEAIIEFIKDRRVKINTLLKKLPKKKKFILTDDKIRLVLARRANTKLDNKTFYTKYAEDKKIDLLPRSIEKEYDRTEKEVESLFHKR